MSWTSTISWGGVPYSVPHLLADETVWVRCDGDRIVIVHVGDQGPVEVARHEPSTPGHPQICDEHYPPRPAGALARQPKAASAAEAAFLVLGPGAHRWLIEAAAVGTARIKVKMAEAVDLAALQGDGDELTILSFTQGSHGAVTCSSTSCRYTPAADRHGADAFSYSVSDGTAVSTAQVTIDVVGVNDAPTAAADTASTSAGSAATIDVLGNDGDVDGDQLAIIGWTQPAGGTVTCTARCSYQPSSGFAGADGFSYSIDDGNGGTAVAGVTITWPPRCTRRSSSRSMPTTRACSRRSVASFR